ncbi:MAG TPA: gamma-glutamylcyclotransferase family protein [Pyrinomonadaceae bacterium]|nr:gamma-glutamylcyclotransferase family protein [Pyrinomonadaceae bacterium]
MTRSDTGRIDVFFYGLFMDEALLREKGTNPRNRRLAALENFQLVIAQRATLVPSQDHVVHGVVFSLTHDELDRLYADPSVKEYRPEAVLAKLADGNAIPCLTFNLPGLNANEQRNHAYAEKLRALAADLNLPPSYVETI